MTEKHRHDWVHAHTQPAYPTRYACTECPATATGCGSCHRILETHGRTCDTCISHTRNNLREIRDLYRALPDVIASIAGLHAIRYDRGSTGTAKRKTSDDTTILGGAAFVMATAGNVGGSAWSLLGDATHVADNLATDPPSVLAVLTGWEDAWRQEQHQAAATTTSVDAAVDYLLLHTTWAAQHSEVWADYLTDLGTLRGRLRVLTGQSDAPEEGAVPCMYCSGTIVQKWTGEGLDDVHQCDQCGVKWTSEAHYRLAIQQAHTSLPATHPDELRDVG